MSVKNLKSLYSMATEGQIKQGLNWYPAAHATVEYIADGNKFPKETVCQVLSALSPRNRWHQNIKDTDTVLRAVTNGMTPEDISVNTFNHNKRKAFQIAKGTLDILRSSRKTYSFVQNILHHSDKVVTVDVWHMRAYYLKDVEFRLTDSRYNKIESDTLKLAKKLGYKGYELQAILWVVVKDNWKTLKAQERDPGIRKSK